MVYSEVHDDKTALTATGVLIRAIDWFAQRGVIIERVLSDNGSAYTSHLWHQVCDQLAITVKKTRPRRPQTHGKIERRTHDYVCHRTKVLFAALEIATGPATGACKPRYRCQEFLAFLRQVALACPISNCTWS